MELAGLLVVGIVLIALGCRNRKGDISTIHWYNRTKVTGEDIPKYGRVVGLGCVLMGESFLLAVLAQFFVPEEWTAVIILAGTFVGLTLILYGQIKYNKGIF